ncbi:ABC transporter ATP-binding protein [Halobacterium sp. KA-4]|uniref:ABC transporter ATP-binding protein n=1 Tax=Halobacterium sp. KA-4 TaxID=2896367 RepID=UPI001E655D28|nr:ABC transporter ATP-binding protein [Halobacterium sp. KA-4]MCD2201733.1 ABC transporter ATP-binding protein [Halobacterium sp. KA-4]
MSLLSIEDVDVSYGDVQVLWDVSIDVDHGDVVALLGANGAGKTTVLKTVCGDLTPTSGRVIYDSEDITGRPPEELVRAGIAHVPEGREIFTESSVEENIDLGAHATPTGAAERKSWVFDVFPRLKERRNQTAGTLSGGEQQMLAIGRALMSDPELLLLDEASLGLAPVLVEDVFAAIEEVTEHGVTVLLVEQDLHNALRIADRGYVLESGRVVLSGDAAELEDDDRVEESYLGG